MTTGKTAPEEQEQMEENHQTSVKPTEPQKTFADVLAGWLRVWSRLYRRELTEEDFAIYGELLKDLTPEQLDAACRAASRRCTFFPTPAEIRAQIQGADELAGQARAEGDWQTLLAYLREWGWGDGPGGLFRGAPELPALIEYAARAAGEIRALVEQCSAEDRVWQKRRFVEADLRGQRSEQLYELPSIRESRKLLRELAGMSEESRSISAARLLAPPQPKALASCPAAPASPTERQEAMKQVVEVMRKIVERREPPPAAPDPEEIERRKRSELKRFERYLREHPELSAAKAEAPAPEGAR